MRDVAHCRNWLVDMDGVLVRDDAMVEGANEFLDRLRATGRRFLVLTNNSLYAPDDLRARLAALGVEVESDQLWTSALATARFVATERPGARAFVIGAPSLHDALADAGITEDADDPDYVVLGETPDLTLAEVTTAVRLVARGAGFVASNPEPTGPSPDGPLPGVGATAAMIERAAGVAPY
ncbi:MAG: HAD-IIA family hydrolase, partial [Acidimicrobiales bacterium]